MGISTDAILVYGIDLEAIGYYEEGEDPPFFGDDDESDFDLVLLRDAALAPWRYHEDKDKCEDYKDYSARVEQAQEQAGVELIIHCSDNYPMYILAVVGTEKSASRGTALEIDKNDLLMNQFDGVHKLRAFCERHEIPWSDPHWILCSYWG